MNRISNLVFAATSAALLIAAPALSARTSFMAHLDGNSEVPTKATQAVGSAKFDVSSDATTITYRVNTSNISNVTAVNVHTGSPTENGPIVAVLYTAPPGGGKKSGPLASGTITSATLTGSLSGQPVSALIAEMEAGHVYLNITTDDGVGAPDEKSGDFASGEIRGQIR